MERESLVFDLETDGLLDTVSTIHCLSVRSSSNKTEVLYADQPGFPSLETGLSRLSNAERIIGHNIVQYDIPVIQKLYPNWTYAGAVRDTLLGARLVFTDIKPTDFPRFKAGKLPGNLIGSHSLKAWGYRLGILKGEYGNEPDAWEKFTPELARYCSRDTEVTLALYRLLAKSGISVPALEVEQELAVYLLCQEQNGWPFNVEKARELQAKLSARREEIGAKLRERFGSWTVETPFTPKVNNKTRGYVKGVPTVKVKTITFNPASRDHIANRLQALYGWKPTVFSEKTGKPVVDGVTLKGLSYPGIEEIRELLLLDKRLGQLAEGSRAWLTAVGEDGKIHHRCNQLGAITHRASHSDPNLGQVPRVGSQYGEECRSLFGVPDGWWQVGTDMSGIELRVLAHYLAKYDGGAFTKTLLEADPHAATRDAMGLEPTKENRDLAKTIRYALLYGASDFKIGKTAYPGASEAKQKREGKRLKNLLFKADPALKCLLDQVQASSKRGYLSILDDRHVSVRHEHAALNTLLQSTAAVLAKYWIVEFNSLMARRYGPKGWNHIWTPLAWVHDEVQIGVRGQMDEAEHVGCICVASIESLTDRFSLRCPVTGEYKIGKNWYETH